MDEYSPDTQPAGALVPPPRVPPTAIATSAPLPPRPQHRRDATRPSMARSLSRALRAALDELDVIGDRIASAVGLR